MFKTLQLICRCYWWWHRQPHFCVAKNVTRSCCMRSALCWHLSIVVIKKTPNTS